MGTIATNGGAASISGTLNGAGSRTSTATNIASESTSHDAAASNTTGTTFDAPNTAPSPTLTRLVDELRLSLQLHPTPRAPKPLVEAAQPAPAQQSPEQRFRSIVAAAQSQPLAMRSMTPSTGGATAAPVPVAPSAPNVHAPSAAPTVAEPAPLAFIWNLRYFEQMGGANSAFDPTSEDAVRERAVRGTIKYLLEEEHVDDFGVSDVKLRRVSSDTDSDLLHVNAGARWIADVSGTDGKGVARTFPVVLNADGHTYVDPRVRM